MCLMVILVYVFAWMKVITLNPIRGILLLLLLIMPPILYLLFNRKDTLLKEKMGELKQILKNCSKIIGITAIILFYGAALIRVVNSQPIDLVEYGWNFFHFGSVIYIFFFNNYIGASSRIMCKNIVILTQEVLEFFSKTVILHSLMAIVLVYLSNLGIDFVIGLIGAYTFFFLEKLNALYHQNKNSQEKSEKYDNGIQTMINFAIIFLVCSFESLFSSIIKKADFPNNFWIYCLIYIIMFIITLLFSNKNLQRKFEHLRQQI